MSLIPYAAALRDVVSVFTSRSRCIFPTSRPRWNVGTSQTRTESQTS